MSLSSRSAKWCACPVQHVGTQTHPSTWGFASLGVTTLWPSYRACAAAGGVSRHGCSLVVGRQQAAYSDSLHSSMRRKPVVAPTVQPPPHPHTPPRIGIGPPRFCSRSSKPACRPLAAASDGVWWVRGGVAERWPNVRLTRHSRRRRRTSSATKEHVRSVLHVIRYHQGHPVKRGRRHSLSATR